MLPFPLSPSVAFTSHSLQVTAIHALTSARTLELYAQSWAATEAQYVCTIKVSPFLPLPSPPQQVLDETSRLDLAGEGGYQLRAPCVTKDVVAITQQHSGSPASESGSRSDAGSGSGMDVRGGSVTVAERGMSGSMDRAKSGPVEQEPGYEHATDQSFQDGAGEGVGAHPPHSWRPLD